MPQPSYKEGGVSRADVEQWLTSADELVSSARALAWACVDQRRGELGGGVGQSLAEAGRFVVVGGCGCGRCRLGDSGGGANPKGPWGQTGPLAAGFMRLAEMGRRPRGKGAEISVLDPGSLGRQLAEGLAVFCCVVATAQRDDDEFEWGDANSPLVADALTDLDAAFQVNRDTAASAVSELMVEEKIRQLREAMPAETRDSSAWDWSAAPPEEQVTGHMWPTSSEEEEEEEEHQHCMLRCDRPSAFVCDVCQAAFAEGSAAVESRRWRCLDFVIGNGCDYDVCGECRDAIEVNNGNYGSCTWVSSFAEISPRYDVPVGSDTPTVTADDCRRPIITADDCSRCAALCGAVVVRLLLWVCYGIMAVGQLHAIREPSLWVEWVLLSLWGLVRFWIRVVRTAGWQCAFGLIWRATLEAVVTAPIAVVVHVSLGLRGALCEVWAAGRRGVAQGACAAQATAGHESGAALKNEGHHQDDPPVESSVQVQTASTSTMPAAVASGPPSRPARRVGGSRRHASARLQHKIFDPGKD